MASARGIRRYSAAELNRRRARGEDRTDLARVRAKTERELERDVASDPEFRDQPDDWHLAAEAVMPVPKKLLSLRLDQEVVDWFKRQGAGYQTKIKAVLRAFMERQSRR